jgi:hypothetical protein
MRRSAPLPWAPFVVGALTRFSAWQRAKAAVSRFVRRAELTNYTSFRTPRAP